MHIYRREIAEAEAYEYARRYQGYTGSWQEWLEMDKDKREEYEEGAQGLGTV